MADTEAVQWPQLPTRYFVDVNMWVGGMWVLVPVIKDEAIFAQLVGMHMRDMRANYAVYGQQHHWVLVSLRGERFREYPTREAAEMVAMHNG